MSDGSGSSSALTRWIVGALGGVFVVSVAARASLGGDGSGAPQPPDGSAGLLPGGFPGGGTPAETEPAALETYLPYVTEASFFGLIGFALGYFVKKAAKLALIVIAVIFLAVQGLSYTEVLSVDWSKVVELLNQLVLNFKADQPVTDFLTQHVPTAGALLVGFLLGFKRG